MRSQMVKNGKEMNIHDHRMGCQIVIHISHIGISYNWKLHPKRVGQIYKSSSIIPKWELN